jgi:hypothetical protein
MDAVQAEAVAIVLIVMANVRYAYLAIGLSTGLLIKKKKSKIGTYVLVRMAQSLLKYGDPVPCVPDATITVTRCASVKG